MMKKRFWLIIALATLLLAAGWLLKPDESGRDQEAEIKEGREGRVELILDFGQEEPVVYSLAIKGESTVLTVLNQAAAENDLQLLTENSGFGVLVKAIGEASNTQNHFWLYFVNGKMAEVAADQYQLQPGDKIEWRYQKLEK